jgi:hypothetical protein
VHASLAVQWYHCTRNEVGLFVQVPVLATESLLFSDGEVFVSAGGSMFAGAPDANSGASLPSYTVESYQM